MRTRRHDHHHCHPHAFSNADHSAGSGPFRQRHRFGGFGGGRMFAQGDLRFVILKLIRDKPSHGYELIKAIEDQLAGAYSPSPGVVYPTLTLLEELGQIRVQEAEGPRKLYVITPDGEAALDQNAAQVASIFARMAEINARHGGGPAPQILRAMENLKTALRIRLSRGPLDAEQVAGIAQALDDAARTVEGS